MSAKELELKYFCALGELLNVKMFTCAWSEEAVDNLKVHGVIAAGIHITLNAE